MTDERPLFARSGEFPAPAGNYSIEVRGGLLVCVSGSGNFSLAAADIARVTAGWALPAKGGGFAALWLLLKDGKWVTLLQSEGYSDALARSYSGLGRGLAGALGTDFGEEPQGPDC